MGTHCDTERWAGANKHEPARPMGKGKRAMERDPSRTSSDEEPIGDLNALAVVEFRLLLEADSKILTPWKEVVIELLGDGIPQDLTPLQALLDGEVNAATEETQSQILSRNS